MLPSAPKSSTLLRSASYLAITGLKLALLLNFKNAKLE